MKWTKSLIALAAIVLMMPAALAAQDAPAADAPTKAAETAADEAATAQTAADQPAAQDTADDAKADTADATAATEGQDSAEPAVTCTVKSVGGTVQWRPSQEAEWQAAKAGDKLTLGADICTGFRATCMLEFVDESSAVEVQAMTLIRIGEFEKVGNKVRTRLYLMRGGTKTIVEKSRFESDFAIVTPEVTLAVRGTKVIKCKSFSDMGPIINLSVSGAINVTSNKNGRSRDLKPKDTVKKGLAQSIQNVAFGSKIKVFDTHGGVTGNEQFSIMNRGLTVFGTPNQNAPNGSNKPGGGNPQRISIDNNDPRKTVNGIIHEWEVE